MLLFHTKCHMKRRNRSIRCRKLYEIHGRREYCIKADIGKSPGCGIMQVPVYSNPERKGVQ